MKFCEQCGTQLEDSAKYCSACGYPCNSVEVSETIRSCRNCGAILQDEDRYCPECGKPCSTSAIGDNDAVNRPEPNRNDGKKAPKRKIFPMILLAVGLVLWLIAPFAAVNLLTLGDQPTALQIVTDDILYIGELTDTIAFWAAITSGLGLAVCFISVLAAANRAARIVALLTELPLGWAIFEFTMWADSLEEWFEAFGIGFWGIIILLLLAACTSGSGTEGGSRVSTQDDGPSKLGSEKKANDRNVGNRPSGRSKKSSASSRVPRKKSFKPVIGVLLVVILLTALASYFTRNRPIEEPAQTAPTGLATSTTALAAEPTEPVEPVEETREYTDFSEPVSGGEIPGFNDLTPGQIITLGTYEQDGNQSNGAEPVDWLVLENAGDAALVVSVLGLDTMPYQDGSDTADWESSSIRTWLENVFYENAFTSEEKSLIAQKTIVQHTNDGYPNCDQGAETIDHVFLLSTKEYVDLLYHNEAIDAEYREGVPSAYALEKGLETYDYHLGPRCWWWLRTTSAYNERACFVAPMGPSEVYVGYSVNRSGGMVRPAMWVMLAGGAVYAPNGRTEHDSGSGVLMPAEYTVSTDSENGVYLSPSYTVFGSNINRELITSIKFLDTLSGAPSDAWDVSQAQDGSVLAWVEPEKDAPALFSLYIAGEGGVWAPEDCTYLLAGFRSMNSLDFNNSFHLKNCRTMQGMFFRDSALEQLELPENWDTSTVTNMSELFYFCSSVQELDVSVLDTRSVTTMELMFARCESLRTLDLRTLNTAKVTNMSGMFFQSCQLSDLNVSGFDTSQVTNMDWMFYCCNLEKLDLSSFDTSRVESAMLLWEDPPAVLKTLIVGENFDLPLLRENAAPAAGGTINGQPWEDFLS